MVTAETLAVTYRGQTTTVSRAQVLQAVQAASLLSFVLGVLPSRAERQRLGIETQGDANEFIRELHLSIASQPDAADLLDELRDAMSGPLSAAGLVPLRTPRRRAPRPSQRRRGPRITR